MSLPSTELAPMKKKRFELLKTIKRCAVNIRYRMELLRQKNPKVFDWVARFAEIIWVFGSTYCSSVFSNTFVVAFIMSIAFAGLYSFQWALLTNKSIREVRDCSYNAMAFCHTVAHNIKMQIANISQQSISITADDMVKLFSSALNTLEDLLCCYYGFEIRASIKLCSKQGILKTYARGEKNIKSRGGRQKTDIYNRKEILVESNYAYNAILQQKLKFFAESDLRKLSSKQNDEDTFYCEYGELWESIFLSSIVIPIRSPVVGKQQIDYRVLGLICIDAHKTVAEWNDAEKTYAYRVTAFLADAVYSLIDQYMKNQERRASQNRKRSISKSAS